MVTHPLVVHVNKSHFDVYGGRVNPKYGVDVFGNMWSHITDRHTSARFTAPDRDMAVEFHKKWIQGDPSFVHIEPQRRQIILARLQFCHGLIWGCWCAPENCHCITYANLANPGEFELALGVWRKVSAGLTPSGLNHENQ